MYSRKDHKRQNNKQRGYKHTGAFAAVIKYCLPREMPRPTDGLKDLSTYIYIERERDAQREIY